MLRTLISSTRRLHTVQAVPALPLHGLFASHVSAILADPSTKASTAAPIKALSEALLHSNIANEPKPVAITPPSIPSDLVTTLEMAVASVSNLNPSQDPNLTYGTTPPATILTLLSHLQENCALPPDPSFLDVGCGNGEVTMAAAHHPTLEFKSCHGFDVEPERVEVANKMLTALAPKLPEIGGEKRVDTVSFSTADLTTPGVLGSPDVVFINGVAFDQALSFIMCDQLATIPPGAVVVSTSRRFPSPHVDHVATLSLPSNGLGAGGIDGDLFTFYIMQRVAPSGAALLPSVTDSPYSAAFRDHPDFDKLVTILLDTSPTSQLCLSHLLVSETTTRKVLPTALPYLTAMASEDNLSLPDRAGLFMLLYSISTHPVGAHAISAGDLVEILAERLIEEENKALTGSLISLLTNLLSVEQRNESEVAWMDICDITIQKLSGGGVGDQNDQENAELLDRFMRLYKKLNLVN